MADMKKLLAMAMALVVLSAMLAGCAKEVEGSCATVIKECQELASGGTTSKWRLTEKCRRVMDAMRGI